jgi:hypothetical protein
MFHPGALRRYRLDDFSMTASSGFASYIRVTTTVRGGKYSTTTTRVPVAIVSSLSAA